MAENRIDVGFAEHERDAVAGLYWEAFRRKLRPAFRSEETGRLIVARSLRPNRMLVARLDGAVIGVCGFHEAGSGAVDLSWRALRAHVSTLAALRAIAVLAVLERNADSSALLLDGICVAGAARGRGTGTLLLAAAERRARGLHRSAIRLSVVDTNPRAAALYERVGYRPVSTGSLGLLGYIYGFDGYTTMEKKVLP